MMSTSNRINNVDLSKESKKKYKTPTMKPVSGSKPSNFPIAIRAFSQQPVGFKRETVTLSPTFQPIADHSKHNRQHYTPAPSMTPTSPTFEPSQHPVTESPTSYPVFSPTDKPVASPTLYPTSSSGKEHRHHHDFPSFPVSAPFTRLETSAPVAYLKSFHPTVSPSKPIKSFGLGYGIFYGAATISLIALIVATFVYVFRLYNHSEYKDDEVTEHTSLLSNAAIPSRYQQSAGATARK